MTTNPLDPIFPVILGYHSALLDSSGSIWSYIMAVKFNHDPPLFIPVKSNSRELVAVLPEVIHTDRIQDSIWNKSSV